MVIVKVNGNKCRALLDTDSSSAYVSATLVEKLNKKPPRTEYTNIEMMMHTATRNINIYQAEVSDVEGNHSINFRVSKVDQSVLISLPNPHYQSLYTNYNHLKDMTVNHNDTKPLLPVYFVLGASEYAKIKTKAPPNVGQTGEPVDVKSKYGWILISSGQDVGISTLCLAQSSTTYYHNLYNLDLLGPENENDEIAEPVYNRFKEQLNRSSEGWCEMDLLWKSRKDNPQSNKTRSISRSQNVVKRLSKDPELI